MTGDQNRRRSVPIAIGVSFCRNFACCRRVRRSSRASCSLSRSRRPLLSSTLRRAFYLVLVCLAALSAVVALAPVALHRAVFHLQVKPALVRVGHNALRAALALVSLLLVGVVVFVFDVVVGLVAGVIAGVVLGAVILVLWIVVPVHVRRRGKGSIR